jgi:glucose/arabinose dehydrogenase
VRRRSAPVGADGGYGACRARCARPQRPDHGFDPNALRPSPARPGPPRPAPARLARRPALAALIVAAAVAACTNDAALPIESGIGANPQLPRPDPPLLPTVHIAPARGWPEGAAPVPAAGTRVTAFARGLEHPRWLHVLPNGDVLVAESNGPPRPDDARGVRGFVMKLVMKRAGAGVPSANRITLLRDTDGDGVAETRSVLLSGLNSPFGMALVGDALYVADTDAVRRFVYVAGTARIEGAGETLVALPAGRINHHWTKGLVASADGSTLYVSIGSNSNIAENGIEAEDGRAAIWAVDTASGRHRVFASGLRNPVGLAWEPTTRALWTAVNERDELGGDLVPDYMTSVRDGGFYGWPYSWFGAHVDTRVSPQRPDLVATALVPDYALGAHTASLGLAFADGSMPAPFARGAFVGQHGSWNRRPRSGYKVIFVPFDGEGRPSGPPADVLTGFLDGNGNALGRPAGVVIDRRGGLLVADDVGNTVWRVAAAR